MGGELSEWGHEVWDGLVTSLLDSTQGPIMHASWVFVAVMTLFMTGIAVARMLPSTKARRVRRRVAALRAAAHDDVSQERTIRSP